MCVCQSFGTFIFIMFIFFILFPSPFCRFVRKYNGISLQVVEKLEDLQKKFVDIDVLFLFLLLLSVFFSICY